MTNRTNVAELERLENLIGVCIREYKFASKIDDGERIDAAAEGLKTHAAELAELAASL
jgi:hypothetical protein